MSNLDNNNIINALNAIVDYNGLFPVILEWIKYGDNIIYNDSSTTIIPYPHNYLLDPPNIGDTSQLQIFWMLLVLLFGDYGTSPRFGWINADRWKECKEFINTLCKDCDMEEN